MMKSNDNGLSSQDTYNDKGPSSNMRLCMKNNVKNMENKKEYFTMKVRSTSGPK